MKFKVSILEYLGRVDIGVLVLLSIIYNEKYYEATYFYTSDKLVFTVDERLKSDLGHDIKEDSEYTDLIRDIIRKVAPYDEVLPSLEYVDFSRWFKIPATLGSENI